MNTFNDGAVGEPEQDANSALTELDKGLRSGKVGEQCEAIVRFPRLFEKYPFPILINSSFLKLADVFRMGNNFLRLWVLRVCQQSEKHLDKILNIDEFVRRVFSVLHSNDPVARALALRTLGAVAGIIPDRQNVHHAIRRGLDSHDNVEVDAAIHATTQFAAHSNVFAVSMCNKLSDMVECETTGAERRAKLVRALRTVHGGAVRAHGVLSLLRSLLDRFPSSSSVRAAIAALTAIATDTVVHVPDQVELLLSIAVKEGRSAVRRSALQGLKKLAEHAALWPSECVSALVSTAAGRNHDIPHMMLCLQVMQILVKCPAVCAAAGALKLISEEEVEPSSLRSFCTEATLSVDLQVASIAADVLTHIAVYCYQENQPVEGASELMISLESLVIATGIPDEQNNVKPLRIALRCLIQLCNAEPTTYSARTARVLGGQLKASRWVGYQTEPQKDCEIPRTIAILEALCALGGTTHCPESLRPAMPSIVAKLKEVEITAKSILEKENVVKMETEDPTNPPEQTKGKVVDDGTALVLLCTAVLQERAGAALTARGLNSWEPRVLAALGAADGWTRYRIARAALRYGHHSLAATLLSGLSSAAPSESAQRWLSALHRAASADATLKQEGISGLEAAAGAWERAGGAGGAGAEGGGGCAAGCGGCGACTPLGASWMCARAAWLAALSRAAQAARVLCTQPPPAIAHSQAQAARDPSLRAGACAAGVRRAARAALTCGQRYAHIARTAFHADTHTLRHLHILQHTCHLMSQFMERITSANYAERQAIELSFSGKELRATNLEEKIMLSVCMKIEEISAKLFDRPDTKSGITHRHMEALLAAVRACAHGALWSRGACAGRAGGALCRVSLSPAPRAPPADHAAALPIPHHLALKVEGVILPPGAPLSKNQERRQVKGVQLTVTATPHPRTSDKNVELSNVPAVLTAVQTVSPVRDFFSAQQLVSVNTPGLYTVAVEAAFIDQNGDLWNTGPRSSVVIKAHEDPTSKSNVQAARSRF